MSTAFRTLRLFVAGLALPAAAVAAQPVTSEPSQADATQPARCEVWARELGFARSVADHDVDAFADHVHADAVFGPTTPEPAHGREAVVRQWDGLIAGKGVRLYWYPAKVVAAGTGGHAWSTGPALYDDPSPTAKHRYRLGRFNSVWHRDGDGAWRVLFDDGDAPQPASEDQAAAFHAGRIETCPQP